MCSRPVLVLAHISRMDTYIGSIFVVPILRGLPADFRFCVHSESREFFCSGHHHVSFLNACAQAGDQRFLRGHCSNDPRRRCMRKTHIFRKLYHLRFPAVNFAIASRREYRTKRLHAPHGKNAHDGVEHTCMARIVEQLKLQLHDGVRAVLMNEYDKKCTPIQAVHFCALLQNRVQNKSAQSCACEHFLSPCVFKLLSETRWMTTNKTLRGSKSVHTAHVSA